MHLLHCPGRLRKMSWTTGQAFAMKRSTWAHLGQTSSVRDHMAVTPVAPVLESRLRSTRHNEFADLRVKGSGFKSC